MPSRFKILIFFCVIHIQNFSVSGFNQRQTGQATFYSNRFWGDKTKSGEKYNPYLFTAAHRYFPLGSWVEVIFPKTNKSIIVRVNDRGPFRKGVIIDLSMIAAQQIGLIPYGISKVSIRLIPTIEITDSLRFTWLARDSINLKLHPRSTQKLKHKKKRSKNKIRVK